MDLERQAKYFAHLVESKDLQTLKQEVKSINGTDLAELLESSDERDTLPIFRMMSKDLSINVFAYMIPYQRRLLITPMIGEELEFILNDLYLDDMIDLLEEMPASFVNKALAQTPLKERKIINEFLMYSEDSAGPIITTEYVDLKPEWSVGQILEYTRQIGMTKETVYTCYVKNEYQELLGFVFLRQLVTENPQAKTEDIIVDGVIPMEALDDQEDITDKLNRYGYLVLSVVGQGHRLIGTITVDDIMDVMMEETTEDFHRMIATEPSERDYMEEVV